MQANIIAHATRISKQVADEMSNNTGTYEKLNMTMAMANETHNVEAFIAAKRREPNSPRELINEYEFHLINYYEMPANVDLNLDNVKETTRFIKDKKCGLDVPTLGELLWHFTGEATFIWTVDLNPHHHTQYRFRNHCHRLTDANEAMGKVAQSATAFATALMLEQQATTTNP